MKDTKDWVFEKLSEYKDNPVETLEDMLSTVSDVMVSYKRDPDNRAVSGLYDSCVKHTNLFLEKISNEHLRVMDNEDENYLSHNVMENSKYILKGAICTTNDKYSSVHGTYCLDFKKNDIKLALEIGKDSMGWFVSNEKESIKFVDGVSINEINKLNEDLKTYIL
jgi:hypothetical protein